MYQQASSVWIGAAALALLLATQTQAFAAASAAPAAPAGPAAPAPAVGASSQAPSGPVMVISYVEFVRSDLGSATKLLHTYTQLERQAARADPGAQLQFAALQEVGRPERWVVVGVAANDAAMSAAERRGAGTWQQIEQLLIAPPDRRPNHLPAGTSSAPVSSAIEPLPPLAAHPLYVVAHLDFPPDALRTAIPATQRWVDSARSTHGNVLGELWQQDGHANHFATLLAWSSRTSRDAFADSPSTRTFRLDVATLLSSPMDAQLFERRD